MCKNLEKRVRMMSDQTREIDTEKLGKRKNQRSFLKPKVQPGGLQSSIVVTAPERE